jgi:hypothetical protein
MLFALIYADKMATETVYTTGKTTSNARLNIGSGSNSTVDGQIAFPDISTSVKLVGLGTASDSAGTALAIDINGIIKKTAGTHTTIASIDSAITSINTAITAINTPFVMLAKSTGQSFTAPLSGNGAPAIMLWPTAVLGGGANMNAGGVWTAPTGYNGPVRISGTVTFAPCTTATTRRLGVVVSGANVTWLDAPPAITTNLTVSFGYITDCTSGTTIRLIVSLTGTGTQTLITDATFLSIESIGTGRSAF